MEFKNKEEVDRVLSALGEQLSAFGQEAVDLLVCGGSALQALRLVTRTTKDEAKRILINMGHNNVAQRI